MDGIKSFIQPREKKFRWYSMGLKVRRSNPNLSTEALPHNLSEHQVKEALELGFEFFHPFHMVTLKTFEEIKEYLR